MVAQIAEGVAVIDQVITKSWWFSPFGDWTLSAPHNKSVVCLTGTNLMNLGKLFPYKLILRVFIK
jgi:hypothetical protein